MKRIITLIVFSSLLLGCTTTLTNDGESIKVIDAKMAEECKFVHFVTGSNSNGINAKAEIDNAITKVRNKASELGANAVQIMTTDWDYWGGGVVTANAYKCSK